MKYKEQKVAKYSNLFYAHYNIEGYIKNGWFVHTCVSYNNGNIEDSGILVVYERELEN